MTEATPEDRAEQLTPAAGDDASAPSVAAPGESDPFDAAEQAAPAGPGEHRTDPDLPLEADAADAAEQAVVVELDEDEHR